jgi:hypothetical protein
MSFMLGRLAVASACLAAVAGCRATTDAFPPQDPASPPICTSCTSTACRSDDDCVAWRGVCEKPEGEDVGVCFDPHNLAGEHVDVPPRAESSGPGGPGECTSDEQCPAGYMCRKMGGRTGHCTG